MKNRFSTRVVATYVEEQLHNGNGSDLLVCAGSSSSVMMSSALIAMWCPAIRDIFMAEPGNPPDAVIFPDLSPAGLYPLKEYIYTGKTSAVSELDALVISGGDYSGHIIAVTNLEEQLAVVGLVDVETSHGEGVLAVATAADNSDKQV